VSPATATVCWLTTATRSQRVSDSIYAQAKACADDILIMVKEYVYPEFYLFEQKLEVLDLRLYHGGWSAGAAGALAWYRCGRIELCGVSTVLFGRVAQQYAVEQHNITPHCQLLPLAGTTRTSTPSSL
jgi:hypothetical protein